MKTYKHQEKSAGIALLQNEVFSWVDDSVAFCHHA